MHAAPMRKMFTDLVRNLVAGARLAVGLRASVASFRISVGALLVLLATTVALDIALDWLRVGPAGGFSHWGLQSQALYVPVLLLCAAILSLVARQSHLMLALPVMIIASEPLLSVAGFGYRVFWEAPRSLDPRIAWLAWSLLTLWGLFIAGRAIALALAPREPWFHLRVAAGAALFLTLGLGLHWSFQDYDWWYPVSTAARDDTDRWSVVSEQALIAQPRLLDEAVRALAPQRAGVPDVYFVGFAPYATQEVFRRDVELARGVAADRLDTTGRSLTLLSDPRSVLDTPIATVSNLRTVLKAVGQRIDPDEDVVLLFVTSHGGKDHRLAVRFPPLRLDELTPAALRAMLDEAGIRWRIIVISACYSGGYIPALADDRTLVLTAAAADRMSFGCSEDSELTFFTDALFNRGLRQETSLPRAFELAKRLVDERERAEGLQPSSDPQMSLGTAMRDRLPALEQSLRSRPPRTAACAPGNC